MVQNNANKNENKLSCLEKRKDCERAIFIDNIGDIYGFERAV